MAFLELRTPRDMLEKARREHTRRTAAFDIDHVFNFFVTANHIRDYVEKTQAVPQAKVELLFEDQDLRDCRDLCDKTKHLRLTKRADPTTHKWSGTFGGPLFGVLPFGANGKWELWSGDRSVEIGPLAGRFSRSGSSSLSKTDSDTEAGMFNVSFDTDTHRQCAARRVDSPKPCSALPAPAGQLGH